MRPNLVCLCLAAVSLCVAGLPVASAQVDNTSLQNAVAHALGRHRGAAVVLDVHTGGILAAYHLDVAARRVAHPGSSIKPFTLLALLQTGKLDSHTALMCKRTLSIADRKLDCSHPDTSEPLDPAMALAYSCNSYFTSVAPRLTPVQLHHTLMKAGFGSVTGLALEEASGTVALAKTPEELQLQAIGEWGIHVTPLELLRGYRDLALLSTSSREASLASLFEGLRASVSYGMARMAQPDAPMKVAGKTGTAASDKGSWTHGWFAGYAPAENAQIALVVFLEKGHGSDAAGIAREIFAGFARNQRDQLANASRGEQR